MEAFKGGIQLTCAFVCSGHPDSEQCSAFCILCISPLESTRIHLSKIVRMLFDTDSPPAPQATLAVTDLAEMNVGNIPCGKNSGVWSKVVVAIGPAVAVAITGSERVGIVRIKAHAIEEIVILHFEVLAMASPVRPVPVMESGTWLSGRPTASSGIG